MFGCAVGGARSKSHLSGNGRGVDHPTPASLDHPRQEGLHEEIGRCQIQRHRRVPEVVVEIHNPFGVHATADSGIIHEYVYSFVVRQNRFDKSSDGLSPAQIRWNGDAFLAGYFDPLDRTIQFIDGSCGHHHIGTLLCERNGNGFADPAASARYQSNPILQFHLPSPFSRLEGECDKHPCRCRLTC